MTESAIRSRPRAGPEGAPPADRPRIQLAIDNFGIGQSSLEQLVRSLPVDVLKLDRSFVADMNHSRERAVDAGAFRDVLGERQSATGNLRPAA